MKPIRRDGKHLALLEARRRAQEELIKYEQELDDEYEMYMQPGMVYLKTFDLQYDESNIVPPSAGTLKSMHDCVHSMLAWLVGATVITVGGYATISMITKMDYNFSSILKKVANNPKMLGIVFMILGIAIIGISIFWEAKNEEDTKAGQMYLKRMTNTGTVVSAFNNEVMKVGIADENVSISDTIKKVVLSILHVLDLGTGTFQRVIDGAKNSRIVQAGIVTFMVGLVLFLCSVWGKGASE